jgi:hypothetical protein
MSGGAGSGPGSKLEPELAAGEGSAVYVKVMRAHNDDIHGICVTSGVGRSGPKIISGSKDTMVKKFSLTGRWEANLSKHPSSTDEGHSYKNWVTALDVFPDGSFVAGHRNSYFLSRDFEGRKVFFAEKISNLEIEAASDVGSAGVRRGGASGVRGSRGGSAFRGEFYKKRNETRVTGVKCIFDALKGYRVLVGIPEKFLELDCGTKKVISAYQFDKPEWVYGFASISPVLMVAIHGCALSLFQNREDRWDRVDTLVREDRKLESALSLKKSFDLSLEVGGGVGAAADALAGSDESHGGFKEVRARHKPAESSFERAQRPFISSVLSCLSPGHLALSFFGGLNQIVDVETKAVIHQGLEHKERVWQAVPFSEHGYATCADDKTIKIWDIREGMRSHRTFDGHPGRVSALAFLDENKFVSGTCPENPWVDADKGQLWFYDLRR